MNKLEFVEALADVLRAASRAAQADLAAKQTWTHDEAAAAAMLDWLATGATQVAEGEV